jgi:hypothetical protein
VSVPRKPLRADERARMPTQDEEIGRMLREAEANGELRAAPSYGKPMAPEAGYRETPAEFRLPLQILKDAGVVPPEVETMRTIARLEAEIDAALVRGDEPAAAVRRARVTELRLALALRLEKLRCSGSL